MQVTTVSWHFQAFIILGILCSVVEENASFLEH